MLPHILYLLLLLSVGVFVMHVQVGVQVGRAASWNVHVDCHWFKFLLRQLIFH